MFLPMGTNGKIPQGSKYFISWFTGTIYIPKDKRVPDSITVSLKTRGEREGE
jgi:hypothetical protein